MLDMAFELDGKKYTCNSGAMELMKAAVGEADELGHDGGVKAILWFGLELGNIVEMSEKEYSR